MKNKPLLFLPVALRAVTQVGCRKNEKKHVATPYQPPRRGMKRLVLIPFLCSMAFAGIPGWMKDPMTLGDNQVASGAKTWTNKQTFPDPNKKILIGASSEPDLSGTVYGSGAKVSIVHHDSDAFVDLEIIGPYRNGVSGDRYIAAFNGSQLFTNGSINLWGTYPSPQITDVSMLSISSDVPIGVLFAGGGYDVLGAKHIKAYGPSDKNGVVPEVFELGGQGTIRIYNPYGIIGAVNYATPQLILGNIGYDCSDPAWTYGSINQNASGEFTIGTYDPITTNEGKEITITPEKVALRSVMDLAPMTRPATPSNNHVVLYASYDGKLHALDSQGIDHPLW